MKPSRIAARRPAASILLLALGLAGCAGGPPVFERPKGVGSDVLLLAPVVNLPDASSADRTRMAESVAAEVANSFERLLVRIHVGAPEERFAALRAALVSAWRDGRAAGRGRLRAGVGLEIGDALGVAADTGAVAIVLPVLAKAGSVGAAGGYVPRPMDEIIPLPGDEFDYEVPRTGRSAATPGVEFDLLVVAADDGVVLTHRRVFHPASTHAEIDAALPVLAREATRGFSAAAP